MSQEEILAGLQSKEHSQAREAAFAAGRDKMLEAVPLLVKLLESHNLGVQEAAEDALREIRGPAVVRALIPLLSSDEAPQRNMAMDILREVGKDDLLPLRELLVGEDPDIRIFISDILGSTGDIGAMEALCEALLCDPEVNVRYQAAMSLGNLGFPEAATALNQALEDEEWVQFAVIEALNKVRAESSILAMIKALDKASDLVAYMIVEALGEFGNMKAVPLLVKRLDTSSEPLRNKILESIVKILGPNSLSLLFEQNKDKFRGYLLTALADEDTAVQDAAATGLGVVKGEEASVAILKLAAALDADLDPERREHMIATLVKIGCTPCLDKGLRSKDEKRVELAVQVLARLNTTEAIDLLKAAFWQKGRDIQRMIAEHLAVISDVDDTEFFAEMLLKHEDATIVKYALYFFAKNPAPQIEAVLNKIEELLEHKYEDVRRAALEAAVALGDERIAAFFENRLTCQDENRRAMAVSALGQLGVEKHWESVRDALQDISPEVRCAALSALGTTLPIPAKYAEPMLELLNDNSREVRLAVVDVFSQAGDEKYRHVFLKAMQDPDDWVRARAVEALGALHLEEASPEIAAMLEDQNPLVAIKAIEALARIGGEVAFRSLFQVLESGNPDLQGAAEEALDALNESQDGGY